MQQRSRRPSLALVPIVLALSVIGCGAPGALDDPVPPSSSRSANPSATGAEPPATDAGPAEPAPSATAADAPEPPPASVTPPLSQHPPPVLPKPRTAPPNPYHHDPTWLADEPTVRSSLTGPTVDVYIACAAWEWSVRVDDTDYACSVGEAWQSRDAQLPIIAVTGVPITVGEAPRIEQPQYAPWDPAEHWASVLVVDGGTVPTAEALGARIEAPARVLVACPPGERVIAFAPEHEACHQGGTQMDVGPLADQGPLAVPPPVAYVPLHPGSATYYGVD